MDLINEIEIAPNNWVNKDLIRIIPKITHENYLVGLLWEEFQANAPGGFLQPQLNIIPEYIICREIIWEFFVSHTCTNFLYENAKFVPKSNVTIASVTNTIMNGFLYNFLPYLEYFDEFRRFRKALLDNCESVPETYNSYHEAQTNLIALAYEELLRMEQTVKSHSTPLYFIFIKNNWFLLKFF